MFVPRIFTDMLGIKCPQSSFLKVVETLGFVFLLALVLIAISGCSKTFYGLIRSQPKDASTEPPSTLIKPKIDDNSQSSVLESSNKQPENPSLDKKVSELPKVLDASTKSENSETPSAQKEQTPSQEQKIRPPKRLTGTEQGDFPDEKDQKPGDKPSVPLRVSNQADEDDLSGIEVEERNPKFKKHDHSEYVTKIKNAAIDVANRETDSAYVRMCKHSATDEWSLGVYYIQGKNFYFRTYAWDPIENSWTETFESEKRPSAGLKKHLSFTSAAKKCVALKGNLKD